MKQVAAAQKEVERTKLREEKRQRKLREEIEKQEAEMHNPVLRAMNQKKRKVMPEDDNKIKDNALMLIANMKRAYE